MAFVLILIALAGAGALYQAIAAGRGGRQFPPPGFLIDVGGHRLHAMCRGDGSPVVLLESGIAASSLSWAVVQPQIATFTRVCAYDRAGLAWSDAPSCPRTFDRIVDELAAVLAHVAGDERSVLVGHSFARYIADFDSTSSMLYALGRCLDGRGFAGAGVAPSLPQLAGLVNALPIAMREELYRLAGWWEAWTPQRIAEVDADAISRWVVEQYPERRYPGVGHWRHPRRCDAPGGRSRNAVAAADLPAPASAPARSRRSDARHGRGNPRDC